MCYCKCKIKQVVGLIYLVIIIKNKGVYKMNYFINYKSISNKDNSLRLYSKDNNKRLYVSNKLIDKYLSLSDNKEFAKSTLIFSPFDKTL